MEWDFLSFALFSALCGLLGAVTLGAARNGCTWFRWPRQVHRACSSPGRAQLRWRWAIRSVIRLLRIRREWGRTGQMLQLPQWRAVFGHLKSDQWGVPSWPKDSHRVRMLPRDFPHTMVLDSGDDVAGSSAGSRSAGGHISWSCEPSTGRVETSAKPSKRSSALKRLCSATGCWGPADCGMILRPRAQEVVPASTEGFAIPLASPPPRAKAKVRPSPQAENATPNRADLPVKPKPQETRGSTADAMAILSLFARPLCQLCGRTITRTRVVPQ